MQTRGWVMGLLMMAVTTGACAAISGLEDFELTGSSPHDYEPSDICPSTAMVLDSTTVTFQGTTERPPGTTTSPSHGKGICAGDQADERMFLIRPAIGGTFYARLPAFYDGAVLWARSECQADPSQDDEHTSIDCSLISEEINEISFHVISGVEFVLAVDGVGGAEGEFTLEVEIVP